MTRHGAIGMVIVAALVSAGVAAGQQGRASVNPLIMVVESYRDAKTRRDEIAALMPDDDIVPSLGNARRWRALLSEWRGIAGLAPIE